MQPAAAVPSPVRINPSDIELPLTQPIFIAGWFSDDDFASGLAGRSSL